MATETKSDPDIVTVPVSDTDIDMTLGLDNPFTFEFEVNEIKYQKVTSYLAALSSKLFDSLIGDLQNPDGTYNETTENTPILDVNTLEELEFFKKLIEIAELETSPGNSLPENIGQEHTDWCPLKDNWKKDIPTALQYLIPEIVETPQIIPLTYIATNGDTVSCDVPFYPTNLELLKMLYGVNKYAKNYEFNRIHALINIIIGDLFTNLFTTHYQKLDKYIPEITKLLATKEVVANTFRLIGVPEKEINEVFEEDSVITEDQARIESEKH